MISSAVKAPDRVEFEGKAYFEIPNDVPSVRKEVCVSLRREGKVLTAWASAPVDTLSARSACAGPLMMPLDRPKNAEAMHIRMYASSLSLPSVARSVA